MRWFPVVVVLLVVGCKKSEQPAPAPGSGSVVAKAGSGSGSGAGSGSGSGSAAAAAPTTCFGQANAGMLVGFVADDKTATLCADFKDPNDYDKPATHKCMAVDLATGTYTDAKPLTKPAAPFEYKYDDGRVQACASGKCVKLDLPKLPKNDPPIEYTIHASADGKKLVVVGGNGDLKGIALVDAATGKKTKVIPFGDPQSDCLGDAYFIGDDIYAMTDVCAGPGGTGHLLHASGKEYAKIDSVNVYAAVPLQLDGDQWAFADFGGGNFTIWDVKAGKEVRTVKLDPPDPCEDCELFDSPMIETSTLVKLPSGKLASVDGAGVTVVDPQTGKAGKLLRFPICPAPK